MREERSEAMEADHQVIRKSFRAKFKHRYPLLFRSSSFVTSLLQKSHVSILFCQPKEIQRRFPLLWKKGERGNSVQCFICSKSLERQAQPWAGRVAPPTAFSEDCTQRLSIRPPELWTASVSICGLSLFVSSNCYQDVSKGIRKVWERLFFGSRNAHTVLNISIP